MKKLTTGIFTVVLGLVAADASAAVTSKAYVDARVGAVDTKVEGLETTVNQFTTNIGDTITNQITQELKSDTSEIAKALDAKADAADLTALGTRVTTAEGEIDTLQSDVSDLKKLNGGADAEGSIANTIANELKNYSTTTEVNNLISTATDDMETQTHAAATYATKAQLTAEETARTSADNAINAKIGTVAEGKTVVQMINEAAAGAEYDDTEVRGLISTNASGIAANKTAVEKAQADATKGIADAAAAQTTANAAIPKPAGECANPTNKCVLTFAGGNTYAWEVIEREGGQ
ncbi:MAG: hypothetical protein K2L25_03550 [Alphaproteobacteria bacterium]|nr:hypothetical protein [Alphaproteobacteria bacterium]